MILHKGIAVAAQPTLVCVALGGTGYRDEESCGHGLESRFTVVHIRKIREVGNTFLF